MKQINSIVVVITILLILGLGYFFLNQQSTTTLPPQNVLSSPSLEENPLSSTPNNIETELRAGGSSYRDPNGMFVLLYPNDYVLDTSDAQHPRIYKTGPSQRGQTEMYDGVIMVFETIDLGNQTLETWVDNAIKTATADGTSTVIEPKKATSLNGYPGFMYTLRGLGESEYLVIQKDKNSDNALSITFAVNDPTSAGFQEEVEAILSTVELLK